jgi:hypothetical protein
LVFLPGHHSRQFEAETYPNSRFKSRKGPFLHLDNARPHSADHEIQENNLIRLSHPTYSPELAPADFWFFVYPKVMLEESSFETSEEQQEKVTGILISIPTSTIKTVFEEWKKNLINTPSQRYKIDFKTTEPHRSS